MKELFCKIFFSRAEAMTAMKKMNQSYLSSACTQPIVVKFADTPREKEKRKLERQVRLIDTVMKSKKNLKNSKKKI